MTVDITIRAARSQDASAIADFNCRLALETESRCLNRDLVLSGVQNGLNLGDEVHYFIAEDSTGLVGQIMVTREWSDWRNGWIAWLQSVYVRADRRRCGVFRSLLKHAISEIARGAHVVCIRLYVEHANHVAKQVYENLGFRSGGYEVMERQLPANITARDCR